MNRRKFLRNAAFSSIGGLAISNATASMFLSPPSLPAPGLQLFTFFMSIDNDVPGTLKAIADAGYKNIESAFSRKGGFYGMKPKEFASMLNGLGLSWKAHHIVGAPRKIPHNPNPQNTNTPAPPPMMNLRDNYQQVIDEVKEGGAEWLVCASTPIATIEEIKNSLTVLNKAAEAATSSGIKFAYHNHDAEFRSVDGTIPYEVFLRDSDASKLKMELDLAWAVKGGASPVELFKKHPGRFPLWHVKDLDAERKTVMPVGTGTIDFKPIFQAADTSGLQYYFVEHDMPKDPLASITESMKNISKLTL